MARRVEDREGLGNETKARGAMPRAFAREIRRRPTLPGENSPSTIGAGELNFRVRNGNGCDIAAMATGNLVQLSRIAGQCRHPLSAV